MDMYVVLRAPAFILAELRTRRFTFTLHIHVIRSFLHYKGPVALRYMHPHNVAADLAPVHYSLPATSIVYFHEFPHPLRPEVLDAVSISGRPLRCVCYHVHLKIKPRVLICMALAMCLCTTKLFPESTI